MNNPSLARTLAGVGVVGVGVLALLGSLQVINSTDIWSTWWPLGLVAIGILMYVSDRSNVWWAGIFTVAGVGLLLNNLDVIEFNVFSLFWPAVIIGVGISLLRQGRREPTLNNGDDNYFVLMSGSESRNASKDYKGGKATAIMGGVNIDLRNAVIKKKATLEIFALMGGVEIRVPRGWVVKSQAIAFLGGVENKADDLTKADAPVLTIVGNVVMGGVEIKY